MKLIDKDVLIAEIERQENEMNYEPFTDEVFGKRMLCKQIKTFLDTLEVIDPYEDCVQYDSIKAGIQAHAETYSFNIESELFNQLTKEQQALWRKEIEQACISGGDAGATLARDSRYKENIEMKEMDLEKEIKRFTMSKELYEADSVIKTVAEHFFELGLKIKENKVMTQEENEDLEIEIILWTNAIPEIRYDDVKRIAEYFYELGIKAQKGE